MRSVQDFCGEELVTKTSPHKALVEGENPELALRPAPTETQNPVPSSLDTSKAEGLNSSAKPAIKEAIEDKI